MVTSELVEATYQSNMVFILESSLNTSNESFSASLDFVHQLVANQPVSVEEGSAVSVVLCGQTARLALATNVSGLTTINSTQALLQEIKMLAWENLGMLNLSSALTLAAQLISSLNMSTSVNRSTGQVLPLQTQVMTVLESQVDTIGVTGMSSINVMKHYGAILMAVSTDPSTSPSVLEGLVSQPASSYSFVCSGASHLTSIASAVNVVMTPGRF